MALVFDRTEDAEGFQILRRRSVDLPIEVGAIYPLREGKPIDGGEVLSLRRRKDFPLLFDVKIELPEVRRSTSDGPAQVATDDYRRGWDAIWSKPN